MNSVDEVTAQDIAQGSAVEPVEEKSAVTADTISIASRSDSGQSGRIASSDPPIESQDAKELDNTNSRRPSLARPQGILKPLGLEASQTLIAKLFGWRRAVEEPRPAFYHSHIYAAFHSILHIIPVIGAVLLIWINVRKFFIGYTLPWLATGVNDQLAALQFVAKAHELLMLSSLSAIIFRAVRWQLALGGGLPFGTVFVALNFNFLNILWSMEYWGAVSSICSAKTRSRLRVGLLMVLLTTSCILGAMVGPSSANLLIPRWRDWPAGGTTYYINATSEELFPTEIELTQDLQHCTSRFDDPACPYGGYDVISGSFMSAWANMQPLDNTPETIYLPSRQALNSSGMIWTSAFSLATVSPAAISDGLSLVGFLWAYSIKHSDARVKRQWSKRDNAIYSVETRQPIVMVYCNQYSPAELGQHDVGGFANLQSGGVNKTYDGDHRTLHYRNTQVTNLTTQSLAQKYIETTKTPGILWLEDEGLREATASTLSAIVTLPESTLGYPTYYSCSIDSRFAPVILTTATHSPKIIDGDVSGMQDFGTYNHAWDKVYPSPKWAGIINVDLPPSNNSSAQSPSPFAELIRASGLWNNENTARGDYATYIVESALASLLANGIARISYNTSMAGTLRSKWEDELLPQKQMGWGGDAYSLVPAEKARSVNLTMHATASGYGYSWHGTAQRVSIAALLTYVLLAVGTIVDAVVTGQYSASWDTAAGITALAFNSERAAFLLNTGTGIRSMATFAVLVEVVDIDGHVELRPVNGRNGRRIDPEVFYC